MYPHFGKLLDPIRGGYPVPATNLVCGTVKFQELRKTAGNQDDGQWMFRLDSRPRNDLKEAGEADR